MARRGLHRDLTDWGLSREFGRDRADWDFLGHRMPHAEWSRSAIAARPTLDPLRDARLRLRIDASTYGAITYAKTNMVMRTLEGLLGPTRSRPRMRDYYETWRFHHPRMGDFVPRVRRRREARI